MRKTGTPQFLSDGNSLIEARKPNGQGWAAPPMVNELENTPGANLLEAARRWFADIEAPQDVLSAQEIVYLWLRFGLELRQAEIARILRVCYQRSSTIERTAIQNLRHAMMDRRPE